MDYLKKIEKEVQYFAEVISEALHIECEIISSHWQVVGSTGVTFHGNDQDWNPDNSKLCNHVFETKRPLLLTDPGENVLCAHCTEKGNCLYKAALYYPILLGDVCHGTISLAAFTEAEYQNLSLNSFSYTKFMKNMAEILASKVHEQITKESLSKANQYLQTMISSVHEGIIACDNQGFVTCFNESAQKMTGISSDHAIGRHLKELNPDPLLLKALEAGHGFEEESIQFQRSDGHTVHLISNVRLIQEGDQVLGAMESFNTDERLFRLAHKLMDKEEASSFANIIGDSPAMEHVKLQAAAVAKSPSTVLITGESGTGKELFARAIHNASLRSNGPFVAVNCSAIPENLLESELFGYEAGSFTGAKATGKPGLFEIASGGTIFLDEIGDMPKHLQAKLLRVLQEKRVQHIGGTKEIPINVRIIAATNQDLQGRIADGSFREDLYYRLNVIPIQLPALRHRSADIPQLVAFLCEKYATILNRQIDTISDEALQILCHYHWPGNVRQLENAIEYAINYTFDGHKIETRALPEWITVAATDYGHRAKAQIVHGTPAHDFPGMPQGMSNTHGDYGQPTASHRRDFPSAPQGMPTMPYSPAEAERAQIAALLAAKGSNLPAKKEIAASLGISLATLYRKMKKYGL